MKWVFSAQPQRRSTVTANPQTWQASLLPSFISGFVTVAFVVITLGVAAFLAAVFFTAVFFGLAIPFFLLLNSARSQRLIGTVYHFLFTLFQKGYPLSYTLPVQENMNINVLRAGSKLELTMKR
jgi:hypothetical protein